MAGWTVDGGSPVVDLDADVVRIPGGTTVIGNDNATSGRREVRLRVSAATDDAAILLRPHAPAKGGPEDVEFVLPVTDGRSPTDRRLTIDPTDWHVWTVEWSAGALAVSVDDQEWYRTTDPSRVPSGPLDLGLQVQGGTTARMDVDVVRTAAAPSTAPAPVTVTVTAPADPGVASVTGATDTGATDTAVATTSAPAAPAASADG